MPTFVNKLFLQHSVRIDRQQADAYQSNPRCSILHLRLLFGGKSCSGISVPLGLAPGVDWGMTLSGSCIQYTIQKYIVMYCVNQAIIYSLLGPKPVLMRLNRLTIERLES